MRSARGALLGLRACCIAVAILAFIPGCGKKPPPEPKLVLTATAFADLPGWREDRPAAALHAFLRSCTKLTALPPDRRLAGAVETVAADWQAPCAAAAAVDPETPDAAQRFFEAHFVPFRAADNGDPDGLFTGYYEPELRGARRPEPPYTVPLHRRPPDLVTVDLGAFRESLKGERIAGRVVDGRLEPYPDRAAIEAGALDGQNLELLWVDDPVDAFFLHIQGSGRVVLPDGGVVRVGYAAQNGHSYVAIGRELIDRGEIPREEMSMQAIRAWIAAHPDEGRALMQRNPSYVFFRELQEEEPIGAQGVPLTPGRSLAVDRRFVPLGAPVWLDAEHPLRSRDRLRRLVIAQDTGGAIRGPVRGDLFWGAGEEAEKLAGAMKSQGRYHLLLPHAAAARIAAGS